MSPVSEGFFQDKKPLTNSPVSQFNIDFLMTHFRKENDTVDIDGLRKACAKVHLSIPKSLSKKMSSPQTKNIIYKLAMAIHTKSNESKRYLYHPVFSYKSENIVTAFVDSKTLVNKCPMKSAHFSHSKLWYFSKQCENLNTNPGNILQLICTLSKTFFKNEIGRTEWSFHKPLYYAFYFSKVLCLLMHRLISTKSSGEIKILFDLTCFLYCDIVFYSNLTSPAPKDYMRKHEKIIHLFYSLREKYESDPSCQNSYLYYIFSIFCCHGYIGETMDIFRRILSHTNNSTTKYNTSHLYSIFHTIGIEHFTFLYTPVPSFLCKALEKQLIHWFKPSLNTQHKNDFKSNVLQDPSIPSVLKPALISFKQLHPACNASYNINSASFKMPRSLAKDTRSDTSSFPSSFTQYHDPDCNLTALNLLSLISDYSHKFIFKPFHVDISYGDVDLMNFSFIQYELEKSYAFGPTSEDGNIVYLSVDKLISHLKKKQYLPFCSFRLHPIFCSNSIPLLLFFLQ